MEFLSSSTRSGRRSTRSDACAKPWSSREGASATSILVLLAPARAAKMSAVEYNEATQALNDGAERVVGAGDHYFWRAHVAMATPPPAGESWYLYSG